MKETSPEPPLLKQLQANLQIDLYRKKLHQITFMNKHITFKNAIHSTETFTLVKVSKDLLLAVDIGTPQFWFFLI